MSIKVILIHGNGGGAGQDNWQPYVKAELEKLGLNVISPDFPDPVLARASFWLPYLDQLSADAETVLVGHSSGAVAAMRYAENHRLKGIVLVGACYTDLGMEEERQSGYYDTPWDWEKIKQNTDWIVQFASTDDPWIPVDEARHIAEHLNAEYHEFTDRGHFSSEPGREPTTEFPELVESLSQKLG